MMRAHMAMSMRSLVGFAGVSMSMSPRGLEAADSLASISSSVAVHPVDQVMSAPVEGVAGEDHVPGPEEGEQGGGNSGHAAGEQRSVLGAVPEGEAVLGDLHVRVIEAAVDEPRLLAGCGLSFTLGHLEESAAVARAA